MRVLRRIIRFGCVLLLAAACGHHTTPPTHYPGIAAANAVPDSDPRAYGQYLFQYETWGLEQGNTWPPADFLVGLQTSEPDVFGNQFSKFGFLPDPSDDLPVGFKRGTVDPTKVHETCAPCHTSRLPDGTLWFGAPSGVLDFEGFRAAVDLRWVSAGNPSMLPPTGPASEVQLGPGRTDAAGTGYCVPIPVKYPTYYHLGERTRTNYLGSGRDLKTEVYLTLFTIGAGDPTSRIQIPFPDPAKIQSFMDFFGTISPPTPPAQDATLVANGQAVFHQAQCDACHHPDDVSQDGVVSVPTDPSVPESLPGANPSYPEGVVQTDPLHRVLIGEVTGSLMGGACPSNHDPFDGGSDAGAPADGGSGFDPGYIALLDFIGHNGLHVAFTDGYRVGYLGGLWERAPYLHNGSVPTLADLLDPAVQRPKTWMNGAFLVDTSKPGNSRGGHEFGVNLSSSDKAALIAYLNSL